MVPAQRSAPFDLCESSVGNRAAGVIFLQLAAGAFFLASSGVLALPDDMADFPFEVIGSIFGAILAYMGLSASLALRGFRVDPVEKTIRRFRRGVLGRRYEAAIPLEALDYLRLTRQSWGSASKKRIFYAVSLRLKSSTTPARPLSASPVS